MTWRAGWWWGLRERHGVLQLPGQIGVQEPPRALVYPQDRTGWGEQPPRCHLRMLTPSIEELGVYCSGDQVELRGFPTAHQTPPTVPHIKGIILVLCRGNKFPTLQTPLASLKTPPALPRADSFLVLMILAAYSCPANTFTHLRTMEKAPLGRKEARGEGLGTSKGTAQP